MRKYLKYIFYGSILLFLFHFETLYIGPIKISHLWKGLVLVYLTYAVLRNKTKPFIYKPFLFLAFLQIINIEIINNPFNALVNFTTILIIPMMGIYVLKFNPQQLRNALMFFSSFFILSFIPYKLGILHSFREGYDLIAFGGTEGLIGPFQNPHSAAITLAGALVVILYFWFEGSFNKLYLTILFLLGFYFLLNTYVRTGLAMFAIGSIPTLIYFAKKQARTFLQLAIFAFFMAILASNWILNNEVLMNRITGQSQYREDYSFETMGSGRGGIYITSFEIFQEASFFEKLMGIGNTKQVEQISRKMGIRVGSHNGFLDSLLTTGMLGLSALIFYLILVYKVSRKNKNEYAVLTLSLFFAFLAMTFFQGHERITANIILVLSIALTRNTSMLNQNGNYNSNL
jgi:O-antigen ligase